MATTAAPLTKSRPLRRETMKYKQFTLKASQTAYKGGLCMINQDDGKAYAGAIDTNCVCIGYFAEDKTSSSDTLVNVELAKEVEVVWFKNSTAGDAVAATDFGKACYMTDDQKVTITSTGASKCGIVWAVDTDKGVAVEVGRFA
jgi:hypothetical protein